MKYVVGNWKMYPRSEREARTIFSGIKKASAKVTHAKVVLCPPHLFVSPLLSLARSGRVILGAQNSSHADEGALTGETSPYALSRIGAKYVIAGHSERRGMGETNEDVAKKISAIAKNGMTAILCVGERERDPGGAYFTEVKEQLRASLSGFPSTLTRRLIIAYEPIWAIGVKAKKPAEPGDFREMSILIKRQLVESFGKKAGFSVPILYGGSVDDLNAEGFLTEGKADGFLVGRASLDVKKFSTIIAITERIA